MSVLVIAEHDNISLALTTIATINAASLLNKKLTILVIGSDCKLVVNQAAIMTNVTKVFYLDHINYKQLLIENITNVVLELVLNINDNSDDKSFKYNKNNDKYEYIIAPATRFGKNLLPRIAAKLNVEQVSEVIKIISSDIFERSVYSGNAIETVKLNCNIKCLTIRTVNFDDRFITNNYTAEIVALDHKNYLIDQRIMVDNFISYSYCNANIDQNYHKPELTTAKVVVAGGGGLKSKENFTLIDQLAQQLNAAVGASKIAVDSEFVPNNLQIGQTGKVIAPNLYIAVGISGAIQHLAGIRESKTIIAINTDENAPIIQMSHYFIIGDLFKIIPEVINGIKQYQQVIS